MITRLLEDIIKRETGRANDLALLFSGGVDSLSLGFAAEALGKRVVAYTFRVAGRPSVDYDAAERAADILGWEFVGISVPPENIPRDLERLARLGCVNKTHFECTWPFLYVAAEIREHHVLSGIAADGHYGLSKRAVLNYRRPKSAFDAFRRSYFDNPSPAGQVQQVAVLRSHGLTQVAPYLDRDVFEYFIQFDWDELNTPVQKQIVLAAYRERFEPLGRIRGHANLQLVAGVDREFAARATPDDLADASERGRIYLSESVLLPVAAEFAGDPPGVRLAAIRYGRKLIKHRAGVRMTPPVDLRRDLSYADVLRVKVALDCVTQMELL